MKLAVLGDSDSHAYGDTLSFPPGGPKRGGPHRASALQWTEVLARLRPGFVDQGAWGRHGTGPYPALARRVLGLEFRTPRKEDFAFNFAVSGAGCDGLLRRASGQARQLRRVIERDPAAWRGGAAVIRIGVNDLGTAEALDRFAAEGVSPATRAAVAACTGPVMTAVGLLEEVAPDLHVVLVGVLDNADWPRWSGRWQDPRALANIHAVLDLHDGELRRFAAERSNRAFHDDRAWFRARWGGRGPDGRPAYRALHLPGAITVTPTEGDAPGNLVLADGHASTAVNALWARALVELLDARFGAGIPPITDEELAGLLGASPERDRSPPE